MTGGDSWEIDNVLLVVDDPAKDLSPPADYDLRDLAEDFGKLATRASATRSADSRTINDRIYRWPSPKGTFINQFLAAKKELARDHNSRRAIINLWNPYDDLQGATVAPPLGHCTLYFAIRDDRVNLSVISRSIEAWIGALPNMLAFVKLQCKMAHELALEPGIYVHHIFSYHIYLLNMPHALAFVEEGQR